MIISGSEISSHIIQTEKDLEETKLDDSLVASVETSLSKNTQSAISNILSDKSVVNSVKGNFFSFHILIIFLSIVRK